MGRRTIVAGHEDGGRADHQQDREHGRHRAQTVGAPPAGALAATWSSTPAVSTTGAASCSARSRRRSSAGTAHLLVLVGGVGGFVQQHRQRLAGAEEHRLDRALGDAEVLGDLADIQAEVVPQYRHLALTPREREERFPDRVGVAARGRGVRQVVARTGPTGRAPGARTASVASGCGPG